jgi:alpha,alpha-trehalase
VDQHAPDPRLPPGDRPADARSFWLVSCLAKAGELERAEEVFDRLVGCANDLGLLAEEIDTASGEQLGNFPQGFSHIGLITAAWAIDQARGDDS